VRSCSAKQLFSSGGEAVAIGPEIPSLPENYPQGTGFFGAEFSDQTTAAYGAQLHCAAAGQIKLGFLV
jgi:hypothetical protein